MKKRICDYCKSEIKQGDAFIKMYKMDYIQIETKSEKKYPSYPMECIGDLCIKCFHQKILNENKT